MTDALPDALVGLGTYSAPQTRPSNRVRDLVRRVRKQVDRYGDEDRGLVPEDLEQVKGATFGSETWDALDQHLFTLMDAAFADWIADADSPHHVRACITLPSAPPAFFQRWVAEKGYGTLTDMEGQDLPEFAVLPVLGCLIDRSFEGLSRLRDFCTKLESGNTKLLICGTSVQWAFARRVSPLDLIVSDVRAVPPFGAEAIAALIKLEHGQRVFKSRQSTQDILEMSDGSLEDDYLRDLVAEVRGCPWAALQVLENSVTRVPEDEDGEQHTTWVGRPDWPLVPRSYEREAHFLLHALLIHGRLAHEQVMRVLPMRLPDGLVRALIRKTFVHTASDGAIEITPHMASYTRRLLADAGFPVDET